MSGNILLPVVIFSPMLCGIISFLIGKSNLKNKVKVRENFACITIGIIFLLTLQMLGENSIFEIPHIFSMGIGFQSYSMQGLMAVLTTFIWFISSIYSKEYFEHYNNMNRYYLFMLLTLGATLGVFLSKDLYTTFIFFEIMSFTSYVLVMHDETDKARKAGNTYLTVAVIGGLVMLMGLFLLYNELGTLDFIELHTLINDMSTYEKEKLYPIGMLILFGFGGKAGLFPLHIWLPEAHPVAPAPASALLSCVLTKTGVFGVIILSCQLFTYQEKWGVYILILGSITMFIGAFLAMFSVDLKRIFACSSLSQIGFITVGIGMQGILGSHNEIASTGTILHIVNHAILKLVLFMCAGIIYINTHKLNLNEIKGWGRDKPVLKYCFIMAGFGITGIPYWNGYISKTLLHESIVEQIIILDEMGLTSSAYRFAEFVFLVSGGLTIAYILKIYVAVFYSKPNKKYKGKNNKFKEIIIGEDITKKPQYITKLTGVTMVIVSTLPMLIGIFPHKFGAEIAEYAYEMMYSHAPSHAVEYMAWINLKGMVYSMCIGLFIYITFVCQFLVQDGVYLDVIPKGLSLEEKVYRPILLTILPYIGAFVARVMSTFSDGIIAILRMGIFNNDNAKVIPKEDQYFSTYNDFGLEKRDYRQGFEQNLLFMGLGVAVALIYILI